MDLLQRRIGMISVMLMLPALFLSAAGILYVAFGFEAANRLLDAMMAHAAGKALLSPLAVLGGSSIAFGLNAWRVFHVSADFVNEEFVIALSVKRSRSHLLCLALAGGLLLLLLSYAVVENFRIVAR